MLCFEFAASVEKFKNGRAKGNGSGNEPMIPIQSLTEKKKGRVRRPFFGLMVQGAGIYTNTGKKKKQIGKPPRPAFLIARHKIC